jgi:hypothetical protein
VQVANLSLRYRDLLAEQEAGVQVALRSTVCAHQAEVLARRDTQAVVAATRAQAAVNLREAAESIRQGDEKKAEGFLQKNLHLYSQAYALAGKAVM